MERQPTDDTFDVVAARHRQELHVHCYRMLASFEEAEDVVQDTLLRAWRKWSEFDGRNARAWLYRIATNACTDRIRQRTRQPVTSYADLPWIQPYPDQLLDEPRRPDAEVIGRETIELAFIATLQLLPARQRAVLIMRDVIGWSAAEAADILEISSAAANSALQRARSTLRQHGQIDAGEARQESTEPTGTGRTALDAEEQALLRRYIALHEHPDRASMRALVHDDIRITMPPQPVCFDGWAALEPLHATAFGPDRPDDWRLVPTSVNRMPAAACYRRPRDDRGGAYTAFKLDVIRVVDGLIAEITTFDTALFDALGLPEALPTDDRHRS